MIQTRLKLGQELIVTRPYGQKGSDKSTVVKIGNTYFYTGDPNNSRSWRKFRIDDRSEFILSGYMGGQAWTPEEWVYMQESSPLLDELRERGVTLSDSARRVLSNLHLRAILRMFKENPDT